LGSGEENVYMSYRKDPLIENEIYHIYTRSISNFIIFRSDKNYKRIIESMYYYLSGKPANKFSKYIQLIDSSKEKAIREIESSKKIVQLISYCIMPTHIHLILKQLVPGGISKYMNLLLKSYGKYFNIKYRRHGPLYEGRFKNVRVETHEQLLHLTRYVHLNPVSISLVKNPQHWDYSSYKEYIGLIPSEEQICKFSEYIDIKQDEYKQFVCERIDYQKELQKLKHLLHE